VHPARCFVSSSTFLSLDRSSQTPTIPPAPTITPPSPQVLISSLNSFAAIVVLLALFWLVFSIVGLHVFGGLPLAEHGSGWPNCDSLINSGILNFHVRQI
jgi:hypothetical protein